MTTITCWPVFWPARPARTSTVEKPLSLYIREGRALVDAARKYNRVVQTGTQQRTMEMNRFACEFVRDGGIGKIHAVECVNFKGPIPYPAGRAARRTDPRRSRLGPLAGPGPAASVQPAAVLPLDRWRGALVGQLAGLLEFAADRAGIPCLRHGAVRSGHGRNRTGRALAGRGGTGSPYSFPLRQRR